MIVVDTNVIGYLYLAGERSQQAECAYLKDPQWVAPLLWRSEFCNVLALYLRKELLTLMDALHIIEEAEMLMLGGEYQPSSSQVLALAASSGCSAYDCEFVALAQDLGVLLLTVDKQLIREFPQTAVSLEKFVAN